MEYVILRSTLVPAIRHCRRVCYRTCYMIYASCRLYIQVLPLYVFFVLFLSHRFYSPAKPVKSFYPERPSRQAVVTGVSFPPPPPLPQPMSLFFSRIGYSIPTFQLLMLAGFHQILLTHALVLSAHHFVLLPVPRELYVYCAQLPLARCMHLHCCLPPASCIYVADSDWLYLYC